MNHDLDESALDGVGFRGTRIAPATTLLLAAAFVAQLMVLSGAAVATGAAVAAGGALLGQLLLLTGVAALLERGVPDPEDLGPLLEMAAAALTAALALAPALLAGSRNSPETVLTSGPVAAFKFG